VLRLPLVSWRFDDECRTEERKSSIVPSAFGGECAGLSEAWLVERALTALVDCPIETRLP
jgi:hypothetical protein